MNARIAAIPMFALWPAALPRPRPSPSRRKQPSPPTVTETDTLLIERVQEENKAAMPARGMTMAQVEAKFGAPSRQTRPARRPEAPVADDQPLDLSRLHRLLREEPRDRRRRQQGRRTEVGPSRRQDPCGAEDAAVRHRRAAAPRRGDIHGPSGASRRCHDDARLFPLPAEWEPQSAVLIAWPHAGTDWADRLGEVEETYIALVAAIARFQRVLDLRGRRRPADLCRSAPALRARRPVARALRRSRVRRHLAARFRPDHAARRRRLPPARFPLHRLGRQVRGQPRRPADRTSRRSWNVSQQLTRNRSILRWKAAPSKPTAPARC